MSEHRASRNALFDGLRGLAAVAVMLFHVTNMAKQPMLRGGYLAVDLFFLLSGFVLWNAYGEALVGGMPVRAFVRRRLVRLYPMFAIGMALGIVRALGAMHIGDPRAPTLPMLAVEVAATAFLIPSGYGGEGVFPLDNPAWSLSLEMIVNLAFCLWMARWSQRRLVLLCLVAGAALPVVALWYGSLDVGWKVATLVGGPVRCAFSFTLGMVMARRWDERQEGTAEHWTPYAVLALTLAILAFGPGAAMRPWFDSACVLVAFPVIVAAAADVRMTGWGARIAGWAGELSYPLYVTHYPLILPAMVFCAKLHITGAGAIMATALLCLAVAGVLVPVDRAIRGLLAAHRSARRGRALPAGVLTSARP